MQIPFLQSDTLLLRAPELIDLDFMFRVENDTRSWAVSACKTPYSRYLLRQYIETNSHDLYTEKQVRLIIERKADGSSVGAVDLFDFDPANHRAEVGIIVEYGERCKGYAREAMALLCDYAGRVLSLHQIYAYIYRDNEVACRLFNRCGFECVAELSDWVYFDKQYRAVRLYRRLLCE